MTRSVGGEVVPRVMKDAPPAPMVAPTPSSAPAPMTGSTVRTFAARMDSTMAHARTLALVDAAVQRAEKAELKTALETQVRPKVAEHLRMAQELQTRIGAR